MPGSVPDLDHENSSLHSMPINEIEDIPMAPVSSANKKFSEYNGHNWEPRMEADRFMARNSVDNASSFQPSIDERDGDSGYPIPTTDLRPEAATFRRRQAQMLPICVMIGTGLLYQSGQLLALAGPVSLLLAYLIMGTVVYAVQITIGEMIALLPIRGAVFMLPYRFLYRGVGFACGWIYIFGYVIDFANKAVAFSEYLTYWTGSQNQRGHAVAEITCFFVVPILVNILNVRKYGEVEFWLTAIKIEVIVVIIIVGFVIAVGGSPSPMLGTDPITFKAVPCNTTLGNCTSGPGIHLWSETPTMPWMVDGWGGKLSRFWECFTLASFSFSGNEVIAILAVETENQRKVLPKAVRRIYSRIVIYYVLAVLVLGLTVSCNDPLLSRQDLRDPIRNYPGGFVIMAERAGIPVLPHFINAIQILASISVATINIYVSSQSLQALADENMAPSFLKPAKEPPKWYHISRPRLWAVAICAFPGPLAYFSLGTGPNNFFQFLSSMTDLAIAIPLATLCLTYLFFSADARVKSRTVWKAESPLQPLLAIWGLFWFSFICIFQGYKAWTRGKSQYWDSTNTNTILGFTLVPYTVIALFGLLILLSHFIIDGAFRPDSENGPLRGASAILKKPGGRDGRIMRAVNGVLDAI